MYESRCGVVALAHFSMAGCQRDWSATAFLCQHFHLHSRLLCLCVCGRFTTKMLHYCCKSVSSFNASFLASLFSASIYCNTRDFGSRKICQSPVARVDILMISCVFWVVRCDRICVWVCLSSSAVCVCVISIDLVIPDQALCGLHPSLYFA